MKYYNFFKNRLLSFLLILFVILSAVQIIYATLIYRGLVIDGVMFFVKILDSMSENGYGFVLCPHRARAFILAINQMPVNIAYWLGITSKTALAAIFSLPLFLFPFLVTLYNFALAKRTKRYDIVLLALILYNSLILPAIMYSVVEVFLASTLIIVLLHYYLADIDYTKKDILIIILLTLLLYDSTELSILIYTIMILFPFKAKTTKAKIVKWYINISMFLSSCFIIYMTYVVIGINHIDIEDESVSFFRELFENRSNLLHLFQEPYLTEITTAIIVISLLFYRKRLNHQPLVIISLIYIGVLWLILKNANIYLYNFEWVSYRVFIFIILPILVFFLFLSEELKKFLHKNVLYNLFTVVLLCGITNICIDMAYSNKVHQFEIKYNNMISASDKKILNPETDLYDIYYAWDNIFFSVLSPTSYQLIFSKEYKQKRLVLPCLNDKNANYFRILDFDFSNNLLYVFYSNIRIKNKFWDLTEIGKEFEENENYKVTYKRVFDD